MVIIVKMKLIGKLPATQTVNLTAILSFISGLIYLIYQALLFRKMLGIGDENKNYHRQNAADFFVVAFITFNANYPSFNPAMI